MVTKFRTFFGHIGEAFRSLRRNGWMTVAAIAAVAITLFLVGSLLASVLNLNKLASDIEDDVNIRVSIDLAADQDDQEALWDKIMALDNVADMTYSSRHEELDNIIGVYGEDFDLLEGDDNPLYDVFIVHATSPEATQALAGEIEDFNFVQDVNYGGAEADRLFSLTRTMRNVGFVVIGVLIFTAVFLISNTIRIAIFSRSTEIEIMRLVGAKNSFIRWPFLFEGAIIGLVGSLISSAVIAYIYINGFDRLMTLLSQTSFALLAPDPFLYGLLGVLVAIGVVIGSLGSLLSIRRFLKI
ncbi:Cell division protein FtsX [Alloiococcus otitis]|uniref:Cell division protein FtsX n=1 Tax=Alloiococcus otitis ATCC 51267 TaxID=883081 RepID=K9EBS7_9LACT|nr:permease-like cell division protein FtsX [Alloiococcus otitis]EKU93276.1 hypothetical protein HMPREF9698_01437 [Alloiococcus otitis ATCC 51267]SUU80614.1 Cell division protein FtsX [Alloiococcus otitis]